MVVYLYSLFSCNNIIGNMDKSFNCMIWHGSKTCINLLILLYDMVLLLWTGANMTNCLTHFVLTQVLRMLAFLLDQWKVWKYLIVILWFTFYVSFYPIYWLSGFFFFWLGCSWLVWIFKFSGFCFIMFLVVQKKEIKKEIAHHSCCMGHVCSHAHCFLNFSLQ